MNGAMSKMSAMFAGVLAFPAASDGLKMLQSGGQAYLTLKSIVRTKRNRKTVRHAWNESNDIICHMP